MHKYLYEIFTKIKSTLEDSIMFKNHFNVCTNSENRLVDARNYLSCLPFLC